MQKKTLCILMMLTVVVLSVSACGARAPAKPENKLTVTGAYNVTLDYSQSLSEMIEAGKYFWYDKFFSGIRYRIKGKGQVEKALYLVSLNNSALTSEITAELDKYNLRPAVLRELLIFGSTYPEVQKQFPIIALGNGWSDGNPSYRRSPYLYIYYYYNANGERIRPDECERYLGRINTGPDEWAGHQWRFLATPK